MYRPSILLFLTLALGTLSVACSGEPGNATSSTSSGSSSSSGAGGGTGGGAACAPMTVQCTDQAILGLNLQKDITKGLIGNTADGAGWLTTVDATAGGAFVPDPESSTYGKFTDQGLIKVMISDEQALDAVDWDIAFRRYVVRINSGNSGPSCVKGAKVATGEANYDKITVTPPNTMFGPDSYFDAQCALISNNSGLQGSPATALDGYWQYTSCVQMTDAVFAVELADGRHVKLIVLDYYTPAIQDQCNTTGMVPMMSTGAANFRVRWAFLP